MEDLYRDALSFGCLRAFRHFSTYLRGREELVITIRNHDFREREPVSFDRSPTSMALPPASPARSESKQVYANETLFLLGAYARYGWPYVWLRFPLQDCESEIDEDRPVELNSIRNWKQHDVKVGDIVEELVLLKASSNIINPFEVDISALDKMQPVQRSLRAGAIVRFLETLILRRRLSYASYVMQDIKKLLHYHFETKFLTKKIA